MTAWCAGLVDHPGFYSRNSISYVVARNWRVDLKAEQIDHLRRAKEEGCCATCDVGVDAIEALIRKVFGTLDGATVTTVPCGHSRRADCLGKRLAQGVADRIGIPFVQFFRDRFVTGSSHPKEFAKLPPLQWLERPQGRVIVIDDVATSGWHLEEALLALRAADVEAFGVAWIGGKRRGENDDDPLPEAAPTVFGGKRRWGKSFGQR